MAGSGSGSRTSVRCRYHVEDLQMLRGRPRKLVGQLAYYGMFVSGMAFVEFLTLMTAPSE
jgi:hypothetical protein